MKHEDKFSITTTSGLKKVDNQDNPQNTMDEIFNSIKEGSGWTTSDYIMNNPHITISESDKISLLLKLANEGILADAYKLKGNEKNLSEISQDNLLSIHDIKQKYSKNMKEGDSKLISSPEALAIGHYTNLRQQFIQKFIDDNNIDAKKLLHFVAKGKLKDRIFVGTAMAGNDGNKQQKILIKKFGKGKNESKLKESVTVFDERPFGKRGLIIMIDDNGKKTSAIFKNKKNADKYNRNNQNDIMTLLNLAKKTPYPKAIDEQIQESADKVHKKGSELYVDSDFVNKSKGKLPDSQLKHAGFGDFYLDTPNGKVNFDRSSSDKFDGMVGRSHRMSGDSKLMALLIKNMGAKIVQESKKPISKSISKKLKKLTEAHVVLYRTKGSTGKPASVAYSDKEDAENFLKDIKKDGGKGIIVQKNVKGMVGESLSVDPRKVYGGTGAAGGMVFVSKNGFQKILDLSKKNPNNVLLVSDDNYTKFGPYYVKNGTVAKYTVANSNYDFAKNKIRSVKVPSDVILKFKVVE